jgi:hypothetical protein
MEINMTKRIATLISLVLAVAISGFGQSTTNVLSATTLAAAVTSTSQTSLKLASVTGITATSTLLYLEDGAGGNPEAVFVNAVNTGSNTVSVTRGYNGTQANQHISGGVVLYGPANSPGFVSVDPSGSCVAASSTTPTVNILTGRQWICSTILARWVPGWNNNAKVDGATTAVASAAGQVTPTGQLFHITGALGITGFLLPTGFSDGCFTVIADGLYTWTAANNIAVASAAGQVVGTTNTFCYDRNTSKFYPAHQ